MTDEEKEKYRGGLIATCKTYCHIDYDDDIEILELMLDTTLDEMTELIPNFDRNNLTSRQKLLAFMSVKELYDNRDKYRSDTKTLSAAVSSMLLKEIYGGARTDFGRARRRTRAPCPAWARTPFDKVFLVAPAGTEAALAERLAEKARYHFDAVFCPTLAEAVEQAKANSRRGLLVCGSEAIALEALKLFS